MGIVSTNVDDAGTPAKSHLTPHQARHTFWSCTRGLSVERGCGCCIIFDRYHLQIDKKKKKENQNNYTHFHRTGYSVILHTRSTARKSIMSCRERCVLTFAPFNGKPRGEPNVRQPAAIAITCPLATGKAVVGRNDTVECSWQQFVSFYAGCMQTSND